MKSKKIVKRIVSAIVAASFCITLSVCVNAKSDSTTFSTPYGTGRAEISGGLYKGEAWTYSPVKAYKIIAYIEGSGYTSKGELKDFDGMSIIENDSTSAYGYVEFISVWQGPVIVSASYWSAHEVYSAQNGKGTYLSILNCT